MMDPAAIILVICIAHLFYGFVCIVDVYFMMLLSSVKWTSNGSQQAPLHSVWENPFLSLSLFFFIFLINPPGHSKPLCFPMVCLVCLSAAAHLFGFYSLCFSSGFCLCLTGLSTFKMMKGSCKGFGKEIDLTFSPPVS